MQHYVTSWAPEDARRWLPCRAVNRKKATEQPFCCGRTKGAESRLVEANYRRFDNGCSDRDFGSMPTQPPENHCPHCGPALAANSLCPRNEKMRYASWRSKSQVRA